MGNHFILTLGIERNIRGNSPAVIRREIKPEAIELPRKKNEGNKPLHKRDEFRTREELGEKRVIKVGTNAMYLRSNPPKQRTPRSAILSVRYVGKQLILLSNACLNKFVICLHIRKKERSIG